MNPGRHDVSLTVVPRFAGATGGVDDTFDLARLTVVDDATGEVLGVTVVEIDPTAQEWTLDATFEVGEGAAATVTILIELLSVAEGVELVAWSGQTDAMTVAAAAEPQEIRQVDLFPGPPDNLQVEAVTIESEVPSLIEGDRFQLATRVQGGGEGVRLSFASRNPEVATVDPEGVVQTLSQGIAVLVVAAGPASDSVTLTVATWPLPPAGEVSTVLPGVDDGSSRILPALGDRPTAHSVAAFLAEIRTALVERRGLDAFQALEGAEEALDGYGAGTGLAVTDGPEVSVMRLALIHVRRILESLR